MRRADLLWLAGLLEGEGCFTQVLPWGYPKVTIQMVDRDVVLRVSRLFKRAIVRVQTPYMKEHGWRPTYTTSLVGRPAQAMMRQLLPLMGRRRTKRIHQLLKEAA